MSFTNAIIVLYLIFGVVYSLQLLVLRFGRPSSISILDPFSQRLRRLEPATRLRILPSLVAVLSMVLVVGFPHSQYQERNNVHCSEKEREINPDIGGMGVLIGLFLPSLVALVVLVSGHLKAQTSGAKELCMAQLGMLVYLSVNLAISMLKNSTTLREILIACSSIEAISATFCMTLSDKEVLASRWLVSLGFLLQMLAFIIEVIALWQIQAPADHTICALHTIHPLNRLTSGTLTWTYLATRATLTLALLSIALRLMKRLNKVEQAQRDRSQQRELLRWTALPATVSTSYLVFSFIALLHATVSFALSSANSQGSWWQQFFQWGQSAPILVTVVTVFHIIYFFLKLFSRGALEDRIKMAKDNGTNADWARPLKSWRTWYIWKTIWQRHPFRNLKLLSSDELLVQVAALLPNRQAYPLSAEEKTQKWRQLVASFTLNDETGILESLDEGAPVDRPDKNGDYPAHLAAEMGNLEILKRTLPPGKGVSYLVEHNGLTMTPLEIALEKENEEMFNWMLASFPPSQMSFSDDKWLQIKETVVRSLFRAMKGDKKITFSKLLRWPGLNGLNGLNVTTRLLKAAFEEDKVDYVRILFEARQSVGEDPKMDPCQVYLDDVPGEERHELLLHAVEHASEDMFRLFVDCGIFDSMLNEFDDSQDEQTDEQKNIRSSIYLARILSRGILYHRLLPLLQRMDDPAKILKTVIFKDYPNEICMAMVQMDMPETVLDTCLAMHRRLNNETVEALVSKGGRIWDDFLTAASRCQPLKMQQLLEAEKGPETVSRMLQAMTVDGLTSLKFVVTNKDLSAQDKIDCVKFLLDHAFTLNGRIEPEDSLLAALRNTRFPTPAFRLLVNSIDPKSPDFERFLLYCVSDTARVGFNLSGRSKFGRWIKKMNTLLQHATSVMLSKSIERFPTYLDWKERSTTAEVEANYNQYIELLGQWKKHRDDPVSFGEPSAQDFEWGSILDEDTDEELLQEEEDQARGEE